MKIFGNPIRPSIRRKAERQKRKFARKFDYDSEARYPMRVDPAPIAGAPAGLRAIVSGSTEEVLSDAQGVLIGTIRMGFGHYRIGLAMASAAASMGLHPYWFDLLSFKDTPGARIIEHLEKLYSFGSRLSQKSMLFNKFYWEKLTAEGFKKLDYNAMDRKMCELMAPIYGGIDPEIPVIGTHVWPSLAAIHAGMRRVINAIPDNWPLGLHLAEGALHTVQTPSAYMGYRTLKNMDRPGITLHPIPGQAIRMVGHVVDHEMVVHLEDDCARRIKRIEQKHPRRFLISVGGAGAQAEIIHGIIKRLAPGIREGRAALWINCGDHKHVLEDVRRSLAKIGLEFNEHTEWGDTAAYAQAVLTGEAQGTHLFFHTNIFEAVYATNLLLRATDCLVTKPSELAFYPVPKLHIQRVGGHEAWGAIRSAEVGDGTIECETVDQALQAVDLFLDDDDLPRMFNENIIKQKQIGTYNGAYNTVELACAGR